MFDHRVNVQINRPPLSQQLSTQPSDINVPNNISNQQTSCCTVQGQIQGSLVAQQMPSQSGFMQISSHPAQQLADYPVQPQAQQPQIERQLSSPTRDIQAPTHTASQVHKHIEQPVLSEQLLTSGNVGRSGLPLNETDTAYQPIPRSVHTSSPEAFQQSFHPLNANYYRGYSFSRMPMQRSYDYYFPLDAGNSHA